MNDLINGKPSTNFWIIGGAALFWNLLGLFLYYQNVTTTAADLQQAPPQTHGAPSFLRGKKNVPRA